MDDYDRRVRALEAEGIPTTDAQGIVDAEDSLVGVPNTSQLRHEMLLLSAITEDAQDPETPAIRLREISFFPAAGVRNLVAENPATPMDVIERLAQDPHPLVRSTIAENPATPATLRQFLMDDPEVREVTEARQQLTNQPPSRNLISHEPNSYKLSNPAFEL